MKFSTIKTIVSEYYISSNAKLISLAPKPPRKVPYASNEIPKKANAIAILVPHPDDEIIGCFHLISTLGNLIPIDLYYITEGSANDVNDNNDLIQRRKKESDLATYNLPIRMKEYWSFRDGNLKNTQKELRSKILSLSKTKEYSLVFCPSDTDGTPDHAFLANATLSIINKERIMWYRSTYLTFPVSSADYISSGEANEKKKALRYYVSQKNLALSNVVNVSKAEAHLAGIQAESIEAFRSASSGSLKWKTINVLSIKSISKLRKWYANPSNK